MLSLGQKLKEIKVQGTNQSYFFPICYLGTFSCDKEWLIIFFLKDFFPPALVTPHRCYYVDHCWITSNCMPRKMAHLLGISLQKSTVPSPSVPLPRSALLSHDIWVASLKQQNILPMCEVSQLFLLPLHNWPTKRG